MEYVAQPVEWLATLTAVPKGLGSNPGEDRDVCKCIVPLRHGSSLNSRKSSHVVGERGRKVGRPWPRLTKRTDFRLRDRERRGMIFEREGDASAVSYWEDGREKHVFPSGAANRQINAVKRVPDDHDHHLPVERKFVK
ncbi:hypothetical protein TNCV_4642801 [Trichonephila clavipes]|nr:hypothetical protein TNCV_4642801 [Trichonephila clavipes]